MRVHIYVNPGLAVYVSDFAVSSGTTSRLVSPPVVYMIYRRRGCTKEVAVDMAIREFDLMIEDGFGQFIRSSINLINAGLRGNHYDHMVAGWNIQTVYLWTGEYGREGAAFTHAAAASISNLDVVRERIRLRLMKQE